MKIKRLPYKCHSLINIEQTVFPIDRSLLSKYAAVCLHEIIDPDHCAPLVRFKLGPCSQAQCSQHLCCISETCSEMQEAKHTRNRASIKLLTCDNLPGTAECGLEWSSKDCALCLVISILSVPQFFSILTHVRRSWRSVE